MAAAGTPGAGGAVDSGTLDADAADGPSTDVADTSAPTEAGADGPVDAPDAGGVYCVGDRIITTAEQYQALVAEHCNGISGGLHMSGDFAVSPGLDELLTIGGDLRLHSLPALKSMSAFSRVEGVGALAIYQNDNLESLDGLEHLRYVAGLVQLNASNPALVSVAGLANLETVGETFTLNAPAKSLKGWHLKSVRSAFGIAATRLTTLEGLEHVTSLGALSVANNANLASLGPLSTWPKHTAGNLSINTNPLLPQCQVDTFVVAQDVACTNCAGNNPTCN
jgi:hypothetical protein